MSNLGKGVTQQLFAEPALQTTHHGQNKYGRKCHGQYHSKSKITWRKEPKLLCSLPRIRHSFQF